MKAEGGWRGGGGKRREERREGESRQREERRVKRKREMNGINNRGRVRRADSIKQHGQ